MVEVRSALRFPSQQRRTLLEIQIETRAREAHEQAGLNQEGAVKRVELGR